MSTGHGLSSTSQVSWFLKSRWSWYCVDGKVMTKSECAPKTNHLRSEVVLHGDLQAGGRIDPTPNYLWWCPCPCRGWPWKDLMLFNHPRGLSREHDERAWVPASCELVGVLALTFDFEASIKNSWRGKWTLSYSCPQTVEAQLWMGFDSPSRLMTASTGHLESPYMYRDLRPSLCKPTKFHKSQKTLWFGG